MSEDPVNPHRPSPTAAHLVHLTDIDQLDALFTSWQGRFDQISNGRFESQLQIVRGERLRIIAIDANQRVRIRGHDPAGLFSYHPIAAGNAASVWQGRRLAPGQAVLLGAEGEADHFSARQSSSRGMSLPQEALDDAARVLLNADVAPATRTWAAVLPVPQAADAVNRHLDRLLQAAFESPGVLGSPDGQRLEQDCIAALVAAVFPAPLHLDMLSLPARAQLLRRAEGLMRSQMGAPLGAIDLCRELGVSDRTLRLAFHERYGIGPMAYFKCLRLNAVRTMLKANPHVTIAEAARRHGFHHLGNFSAEYRRLFGERPSTTPRSH